VLVSFCVASNSSSVGCDNSYVENTRYPETAVAYHQAFMTH